MFARIASVILFCAGLLCLAQARMGTDSNYNISIAAGGGGNVVTVDVVGTALFHAAETSQSFTGITVGGGSARALICGVNWGGGPTGRTAVWDNGGTNQSMTETITTSAGSPSRASSLFTLIAPTPGLKTLLVSWTGSVEVYIDCISFTNVDQTGGATSFPHTASFNTTTATTPITSATGNKVVGNMALDNTLGPPTGTQIYSLTGGSIINSQMNYDTGAATVNIGTSSGNSASSLTAVDVAHN
jgi:hypothetical protein